MILVFLIRIIQRSNEKKHNFQFRKCNYNFFNIFFIRIENTYILLAGVNIQATQRVYSKIFTVLDKIDLETSET